MLTTLRISGFAVVDAVDVRFGRGLNVLTGETGAGKSILVNALHLVLGGRVSGDVLREGADEAVVEALFELDPAHPLLGRLEAAGLPRPDGAPAELLVRRVVSRGGRGRAFVNGALVTVGMLEAALRGAVDVSGQHEHVSLLDPATHLALLDAFAGVDREEGEGDGALLARYRRAHGALSALEREREALVASEGERARRADYLAFQLREQEALDPRPGEDGLLEQERRVLAAAARLEEGAREAEALAYGGEGSASERIGRAARGLGELAALDPRLEPPLALLRSAAAEVEEAGRALTRYAASVGGDPERLAAVEERLEALRALARKYGGVGAALAARDAMKEELSGLASREDRLAAVARERERVGAEAAALAGRLTAARAEAARRFCDAVQGELAALAMSRCRIEVAFSPAEPSLPVGSARLGAAGAERAELVIAPNPGEPARPLARIASGGELSRILLAVKRCLSRSDPVSTYVFDEVDSGIGGAVAESVGRLLGAVSAEHQVICVTHLPQVAAFADRHYRVAKRVHGGRTSTSVEPLDTEEERRREVARMLAGVKVTASALDHAAALIAGAGSSRGRRTSRPRAAARQVRASQR